MNTLINTVVPARFKTIKDALEYVGGLSAPSKMPSHAYGLSAKLCITGAKLAQVEGSTCFNCYALKGMYGDWNKNVQEAHVNRQEAIYKPDWVHAMVFLITKKKMTYFRWHDSGDIQSFQHLLNIVSIAEQCPSVKFWIPTREKKFVNQYLRTFKDFPVNLIVRVSATMIDDKAGEYAHTSTVHKKKDIIGFECSAPYQGGKCLECRACWDKSVPNVSYKQH